MKIESYIPYRKLVEHLQLKHTDNVYLVSDISRLMLNAIQEEGEFKPAQFIESFTAHLSSGNLFIPGFVNTLDNNATVDMKTLKPETGGLSKEAFIQFKKGMCIRTNDPFHSFFIYGKDAGKVFEDTFDNKDTFGPRSVFGHLHRSGGVLLIIDLDLYYGFTFAHYVEQAQKVSYRETTQFQVDLTDVKGKREKATFHIYAKKKGYNPVLNSLEAPLKKSGALEMIQLNNLRIYKIDLQRAFDVLKEDITHNKAHNIIDFSVSLYLKQTIKSITR